MVVPYYYDCINLIEKWQPVRLRSKFYSADGILLCSWQENKVQSQLLELLWQTTSTGQNYILITPLSERQKVAWTNRLYHTSHLDKVDVRIIIYYATLQNNSTTWWHHSELEPRKPVWSQCRWWSTMSHAK